MSEDWEWTHVPHGETYISLRTKRPKKRRCGTMLFNKDGSPKRNGEAGFCYCQKIGTWSYRRHRGLFTEVGVMCDKHHDEKVGANI